MAQSPYVFISYSRHDLAIADRLSQDLRQAGFEVWRDVEQIAAGTNWHKQIECGMSEADALLYLASKHSLESEWMKAELFSFLRQGKKAIPVMVDETAAKFIPEELRVYQWVDFQSEHADGQSKSTSFLRKQARRYFL